MKHQKVSRKRDIEAYTSRVFLISLLFALSACLNTQPQDASQQRRIAETSFDDGLRLLLQFGTFRSVDSQPIVARAASPSMNMTLRAGPTPESGRQFEIRNLSPGTSISITSVSVLSSDTEDGCDLGETRAVSCENEPNFEQCGDVSFEVDDTTPTTLVFDYDPVPCREVVFSFSADFQPTETLIAAVVGPTQDLNTLDELATVALEDGAEFIVLLGDATPGLDTSALDQLEDRTDALPLPVVVVAGDREQGIDSGDGFLRRFGPHEHTWSYKGAKFFTFFSANGSLGESGIDRLDRALAQLQRRGDETRPIIGFTHVPPIDPNGARDSGFRNTLEGARVQAIMKRYDVSMLFAGETLDPDYNRTGDFELVLSGAGSTVLNDTRQYVLLTVSHRDNGTEEGRAVADWFLSFESKQF